LVNAGVLTGYPDASFRPNAQMSREEFAVSLAKAAGLTVDRNATSTFTDVAGWAQPYVAAVVAAGLMHGEEANSFGGSNPVTREQMVTTFVRALGQPTIAGTFTASPNFVDNAAMSDYAKASIAVAQQIGLVKGMDAGNGTFKFEPTANAERQAVAMLLHKYFNNHEDLTKKAADVVTAAATPTTPGTTTGGTETGTTPPAGTDTGTTPPATGTDTGTTTGTDTGTTPPAGGTDTGTTTGTETGTTPPAGGTDTGTTTGTETGTTPPAGGTDTGTTTGTETGTTPPAGGTDTGTTTGTDTGTEAGTPAGDTTPPGGTATGGIDAGGTTNP
jgi:hypothetical protein